MNFRRVLTDFAMEEPQLAKVLMSCRVIKDNKPKMTMAVSIGPKQPNFYYNEEFTESLSDTELFAVIRHEMYHLLNLHPSRGKEILKGKDVLNHEMFNVAADLTINQYISGLPEGCITLDGIRGLRPDLANLEEKQLMEYYYELLKSNAPTMSVKILSSMEGHEKWEESVDEEDARQVIQDIIDKTDIDLDDIGEQLEDDQRKQYRHFGTGHRDINRKLADEEEIRRVNWHEVLRNVRNARTIRAKKSTLYRKNRRYHHLTGKAKIKKVVTDGKKFSKKLYVGVDVSGSISNQMATTFFKNVELLLPFVDDVTIIQCSDYIHDVDHIKQKGKMMHELEFVRKGDGGTSFIPVFEHIKKSEDLSKGRHFLVYLTDLYGSFPREDNGIRTFWITPSAEDSYSTPPFGEVFHL